MTSQCDQTEILDATPAGISRAGTILRGGGLVAIPTETVYGLAGDARNPAAVSAIFAAKGRPAHNPLIVHVADLDMALALARPDTTARALAQHFWPGALTLVAPLRDGHGLAPAVTAGLNTVALRMPAHPAAQALLAAFGGPVAAPSANPSGQISPTTAAHVMAGLSGRIAAVLDGGACPVGVESTIIGTDDTDRTVVLRAGGISPEMMADVLGYMPVPAQVTSITAPGQLASHYAPRASVRLNARAPEGSEVWIGFGPDCAGADFTLSAKGDLAEAASQLFAILHKADATGRPIAVAPVPEHGLGLAINDRLRRAAAPREI
ncbi:L-threonylcarbamoyladenylate synthase [Roseinatronobacter alkalisoli]|uniref:Threonylcarbamoyl-AMP synthase n=1 Tax=Roseinatronobacter alkalisoli TaxID=3028235 RepID=A0ABT5T2Z1_9RHOB|nr:L-threonylcarbamoyladenylate synthase [Roseinatronobacter sp. HJB301]MDD7969493.1 L-threonylcarbamoyladenylate synthase [Roseinatronobacter sp. HJB301]